MITRAQAIEMFQSNDLIAIGAEADAVRKKLHPERVVSYFAEDAADLADPAIATIGFDRAEDIKQRVIRLEAVRRVQEETGGLVAVNPCFGGTAVEYLKTLAISRIYLDNIPHVQTSTAAGGLKVCQIALRFGANDLYAVRSGTPEEELRRLIRDAGFIPKQRDALFRTYCLN